MISLFPLQAGLLALWAVWFSLVVVTNVFDALEAMGALPQNWAFRSQNFKRMRDAVAVYGASSRLAAILFGAVVVWQAVLAVLLWRTLIASVAAQHVVLTQANLAFTGALGLWAGFILAEEIFKQYQTESKHLLFFMAQLLTLGALYVLPG